MGESGGGGLVVCGEEGWVVRKEKDGRSCENNMWKIR